MTSTAVGTLHVQGLREVSTTFTLAAAGYNSATRAATVTPSRLLRHCPVQRPHHVGGRGPSGVPPRQPSFTFAASGPSKPVVVRAIYWRPAR